MISRRATLVGLGSMVLLSTLGGCDVLNPASRLYGTWKFDTDATIDRSARNELQKTAMRVALSFLGGEMTMEFRPDGTGQLQGNSALGGGNHAGTWKLVSAENNTLQIAVTTDEGSHEETLRMLDADSFEVDRNIGGQVYTAMFRRVVR